LNRSYLTSTTITDEDELEGRRSRLVTHGECDVKDWILGKIGGTKMRNVGGGEEKEEGE
jgi:hypothetical protein